MSSLILSQNTFMINKGAMGSGFGQYSTTDYRLTNKGKFNTFKYQKGIKIKDYLIIQSKTNNQ